ncbi:glycosyltransferase 61 family protein [uncultured Desulfovibrio sp.]|uniref:glycosyltransferase 61 family protein n=1 Tax=uncultured Desulfovibrio sp. TaxID=167968 RepID=UPI002598F457|nr:glycosyltransferase 61 family protein [uncultured Desulfovibrio sp.]
MPAEAVLNVTIPVFNHAELVQRTLAALRKTSQEIPFCITVVDNGSDERLVARLREFRQSGIIDNLFLLPRNMGEACAANIGWQLVNAPIYMKLASGMVITEAHWLSKLLRFWRNGLPVSTLGCVRNLNMRPANPEAADAPGGDPDLSTDGALGRAVMIPKEVSDVLGRWNEDYGPTSVLEADFGARMACAGFPQYCYEEARYFRDAPASGASGEGAQTPEEQRAADLFTINATLYQLCIRSWKVMPRYEVIDVDEDSRVQLAERAEYMEFRMVLDDCAQTLSHLRQRGIPYPGFEKEFIWPYKERFASVERESAYFAVTGDARPACPTASPSGSGQSGDAVLPGPDTPPQTFALHHDALLMPFAGSMDEFASGVFVNGRCLPDTLLYRGRAAAPCRPQARLKGPCIFGGYMFAHYGHFLLESLSRYYAIARCKPWPLLFMSPNPTLRPWQKEAFKILGLTNRIQFIRVPTLVDELIVSPPACDAATAMTDAQFEALGRLPERAPRAGKKLWVSRSALRGGKVEEEKSLEAELARTGWEIMHPEELPLPQQALAMMEAGHVAGFDGSAFYTPLFCRSLSNHFILFSRRNYFVPFMLDYIRKRGARLDSHIFPAAATTGRRAAQNHSLDVDRVLTVLREATDGPEHGLTSTGRNASSA